MLSTQNLICFLVLFICFVMKFSNCVEFTFELPDNSEECFHEEIQKNKTVFLEFQVSSGGKLDVDVQLKDPRNRIIYEQKRSSLDSHQFVTQSTGIYTFCFSNKFSSFSHKFVYVDFQVGEEPPLPGIDEHATVLTQMETAAQTVHKYLNEISDAQTHHRLREVQGRKRAEELNERVMWYSGIETIAILFVTICQIIVLRNFFTDRKPSQSQFRKI